MDNNILLIFTRPPIPGQTKTRLIPLLGEQGAADFHKETLDSTLEIATSSKFSEVELWSSTNTDDPFLKKMAQNYSCAMVCQLGNDLGERMYKAAEAALSSKEFVVIIGSDCPSLSRKILDEAYDLLDAGKEAVLGPASDGGYYLIGLRVAERRIFQDVNWGESNVAEKTRENFKNLSIEFAELEVLDDVDTPEDYSRHINRVTPEAEAQHS